MPESLRVGIDVGGTFTDLVAAGESGAIHRCKVFSTPADPSRGVLEGLARLLREVDPAGNAVPGEIVHGSTVATNAVLERTGARTALVTTEGFRDLLAIGRQNRPDLFDFDSRRPPPVVPPELSFEAKERVDSSGEVLVPLDEAAIVAVADRLRRLGVESVAVCLLFSFVRPEHEQRIGEMLAEAGLHVSLSSEVLPEFREYERASTTAINAYVSPILDRYLLRLEEGIGATPLRVMMSNGGSAGVRTARREAVRSILSGPAAGAVGALRVARAAGTERVIGFDMGGTSTDVTLLDGGIPATSEGSVAGLPIRIPIVDIHTVGSGGGSIARVDAGGALRVGPESAGAEPGPACYGRGGIQATVTDANVVLGRLPPDRFLGGDYALDEASAWTALGRLGADVGFAADGRQQADVARAAALGVVRVANARMERALRAITVERGHDPRDFSLVSFGGAGGLHACDLARSLGIREVIVTPSASVLSAYGMLAADIVKDYVRTTMVPGDTSFSDLRAAARELEERGRDEVEREGLPAQGIDVLPELDLRYAGQAFEIAVPLAPDFISRFHAEHERLYGHSDPSAPVEIVNLRLRAVGRVEAPPLRAAGPSDGVVPRALELREVVVGDEAERALALDTREVPVLGHGYLGAGNRFAGPAVVAAEDTTVWIGSPDEATVDSFGNLVIEVGSAS
jgi:N-methylhydantoinase A